jgi:hypothetical protein
MACSLTVHLLDSTGNPVSGRGVYCSFPGSFFGIAGTHLEVYTDRRGKAEFRSVPVGSVEVYVGGSRRLTVGIGEGQHKDVTVRL